MVSPLQGSITIRFRKDAYQVTVGRRIVHRCASVDAGFKWLQANCRDCGGGYSTRELRKIVTVVDRMK